MGITGKRAAIFAMLIAIAVLLLCGHALFKFITAKTGAADLFASPEKILKLNYEKGKFEFFAKDSAKIAIAQAYQQIAAEGNFAGKECTFESGYIHFCSLAPDLDEKFSEAIGENINKLVSSYSNPEFSKIRYRASIKENNIKFDAEQIQLKGSSEGTFAYSFTFNFKSSFSADLSELNLNTFQEIHSKIGECKPKENAAECMSSLTAFSTEITEAGGKKLFDMKSRNRYLINGEYKNIEIKFSI